jgi:hypothetical protein
MRSDIWPMSEVHQARGERRLGAEADLRQVRGDEVGAAADVRLGEDRAIFHRGFGGALEVARVVQQRDQHAEHGAARAEAVGGGAAALVAVHQPRQGERHVERVAHVVVQRVAGQVPGIAALEQGCEIGEGALQRRELDPRIASGIERQHRIPDPRRILDVDAIGHVVLI